MTQTATIRSWERWAAHKPRKGQQVTCKGEPLGLVTRVEKNLCWTRLPDRRPEDYNLFIWCFAEGPNAICDWPTKGGKQ